MLRMEKFEAPLLAQEHGEIRLTPRTYTSTHNPMTSWQPIETAPKDGTEILATWSGDLYGGGLYWKYAVVQWGNDMGHGKEKDKEWLLAEIGPHAISEIPSGDPTHWMPLPEPPTP